MYQKQVYYTYMKHALETHKAFPIVAWCTLIAFALLTYYLTTKLQSSSIPLSDRTLQNVEALDNAD